MVQLDFGPHILTASIPVPITGYRSFHTQQTDYNQIILEEAFADWECSSHKLIVEGKEREYSSQAWWHMSVFPAHGR